MSDDDLNPYDLDQVGGITFGAQPKRVERRIVIEPEELAALRAENARLKAELAVIKARRCETCAHYDGVEHTSICWEHDRLTRPDWGCSWDQHKEAADAER